MPSKQSEKVTCLHYLAHVTGSPGDWLMTPALANGQPAAAAYYRNDDGTIRPSLSRAGRRCLIRRRVRAGWPW